MRGAVAYFGRKDPDNSRELRTTRILTRGRRPDHTAHGLLKEQVHPGTRPFTSHFDPKFFAPLRLDSCPVLFPQLAGSKGAGLLVPAAGAGFLPISAPGKPRGKKEEGHD